MSVAISGSSDVWMRIVYLNHSLEVGACGPDKVRLREPCVDAPKEAALVLGVDEAVFCHRIAILSISEDGSEWYYEDLTNKKREAL